MKGQLFIIRLLVILSVSAFFASCGPPPILIKPAADKVKKVTLVSVTANRGVRNLKGASKMGGITAMVSLVKSKTEDKAEKMKDDSFDFGGNNLVNFAAETFNTQFGDISGWSLVQSGEILSTDAYQKFSRDMKAYADSLLGKGAASKALSALMDAGSITADDMAAVPMGGRSAEEKQLLTQLAQELGVDAVVVVEVDMAYDASTAIGGTGTASASAGIGLIIVNKYGDYVINMESPRGKENYGGYRVRSDETAALIAGNIVYSAKAEAMFKDSIAKGMDMITTKIRSEMNPK